MRRIFFVKYYDKGSTDLGGEQVAAALRERGVESRTIYPHEIREIRDSFLVFIKTSKIQHLLLAKRLGNRVILDVQDTVVFKRWIKNKPLFDGLIFKNRRQLEDFGSSRRLCRVIYHQWDQRYRPHQAGTDELKAGYFGLQRSFPSWAGPLSGVSFYEDDWFANALKFNTHLSLREPGRDFLYKPNCKVSTAAACEAALITTRDESAVELLGPDYPFYTEPTHESLRATFERARTSLGGPEWRRALDALARVREETGTPRVIAEYLRYFDDF